MMFSIMFGRKMQKKKNITNEEIYQDGIPISGQGTYGEQKRTSRIKLII